MSDDKPYSREETRPNLPAQVETTRIRAGSVALNLKDVVSDRDDRPASLQILEAIGRGSASSVLLASQSSLKRPVAVKVLREDYRGGNHLRLFADEAKITAWLEHPGIPPIHLAGNDFMVTKHIDGQSLYSMLKRAKPEMLPSLVDILIRVAETIAYAHDRGVIHRALKPQNIRIGSFGEVFVLDWGMALALDNSEAPIPSIRNSANIRAGTPGYMAPEIATAARDLIGPATDVFTLGGVLYYILSGKPPFRSGDAQASMELAAANNWRRLTPAEPSRPAELVHVLHQAMATNPEDRPSLNDFIASLKKWLQQSLNRRDALDLAHRARRELIESEDVDTTGTAFSRLGSSLQLIVRAQCLWPDHQPLIDLQRRIRIRFSEVALSAGDLGVAHAIAHADPHADLSALRERINTQSNTLQQRQRTYASAKRTLWTIAVFIIIILSLWAAFPWLDAFVVRKSLLAQQQQDIDHIAYLLEQPQIPKAQLLQAADTMTRIYTLNPDDPTIKHLQAQLHKRLTISAIHEQKGHLARRHLILAQDAGLPINESDLLLGTPATAASVAGILHRQSEPERYARQQLAAQLAPLEHFKAHSTYPQNNPQTLLTGVLTAVYPASWTDKSITAIRRKNQWPQTTVSPGPYRLPILAATAPDLRGLRQAFSDGDHSVSMAILRHPAAGPYDIYDAASHLCRSGNYDPVIAITIDAFAGNRPWRHHFLFAILNELKTTGGLQALKPANAEKLHKLLQAFAPDIAMAKPLHGWTLNDTEWQAFLER